MEQFNKIIISFLFISVFSFGSKLSGQEFIYKNVPIEKGGKELLQAGSGGMIAAQFSQIDVNMDGRLDLFVFDREGSTVSIYLKTGAVGSLDYQYTQEYTASFPKLTEFALLRDYNGDGKPDIFTLSSQGVPGIEVWRNDSADELAFTKVLFEDHPYDIIYYNLSSGGEAQLYASNIDIPAIEDIDGDGDLDVLTFEPNSGNKIEYYKNLSVESGVAAEQFIFIKEAPCFGLIYESGLSQEITLSEDGINCASTSNLGVRHSGSTLTVLDANHDGAVDLLVGDLTNEYVVYLQNGRTSEDAWMNQEDATFPSYDTPVKINQFIASFYLDVNEDGKKDLIFTPNTDLDAQNIDHVWLYLNQGADKDSFALETTSFLVGDGLNFGNYSDPCIIDVNGDGLKDIILGSDDVLGASSRYNGLVLLENIGTKTTPKYSVVDEDYLSLKLLVNENKRLSPAAGDLDGDGDMDLLVGVEQGKLFYFENSAGKDEAVSFKPYVYPFMDIDPGLWAKPHIVDLNKDGLGDIVLGEKNDNQDGDVIGGVNYFENIGDIGSPSFSNDPFEGANTPALGGIFTKDIGVSVTGASDPYFIDTPTERLAVVGSRSGRIRIYKNIDTDYLGLYDKWIDHIDIPIPGKNATVALGDIDDDDMYELIVGSKRGGLQFYDTSLLYQDDVHAATVDATTVVLYPNPATDQIEIRTDEEVIGGSIFDLYGRRILDFRNSTVDVNRLSSGVYIIKVVAGNRIGVTKLVVE